MGVAVSQFEQYERERMAGDAEQDRDGIDPRNSFEDKSVAYQRMLQPKKNAIRSKATKRRRKDQKPHLVLSNSPPTSRDYGRPSDTSAQESPSRSSESIPTLKRKGKSRVEDIQPSSKRKKKKKSKSKRHERSTAEHEIEQTEVVVQDQQWRRHGTKTSEPCDCRTLDGLCKHSMIFVCGTWLLVSDLTPKGRRGERLASSFASKPEIQRPRLKDAIEVENAVREEALAILKGRKYYKKWKLKKANEALQRDMTDATAPRLDDDPEEASSKLDSRMQSTPQRSQGHVEVPGTILSTPKGYPISLSHPLVTGHESAAAVERTAITPSKIHPTANDPTNRKRKRDERPGLKTRKKREPSLECEVRSDGNCEATITILRKPIELRRGPISICSASSNDEDYPIHNESIGKSAHCGSEIVQRPPVLQQPATSTSNRALILKPSAILVPCSSDVEAEPITTNSPQKPIQDIHHTQSSTNNSSVAQSPKSSITILGKTINVESGPIRIDDDSSEGDIGGHKRVSFSDNVSVDVMEKDYDVISITSQYSLKDKDDQDDAKPTIPPAQMNGDGDPSSLVLRSASQERNFPVDGKEQPSHNESDQSSIINLAPDPDKFPRSPKGPAAATTFWPKEHRYSLAIMTKKYLLACPKNQTLLVNLSWILELFDQNPTFRSFCDSLEAAGYELQGPDLARALLCAVPDSSQGTTTQQVVAAPLLRSTEGQIPEESLYETNAHVQPLESSNSTGDHPEAIPQSTEVKYSPPTHRIATHVLITCPPARRRTSQIVERATLASTPVATTPTSGSVPQSKESFKSSPVVATRNLTIQDAYKGIHRSDPSPFAGPETMGARLETASGDTPFKSRINPSFDHPDEARRDSSKQLSSPSTKDAPIHSEAVVKKVRKDEFLHLVSRKLLLDGEMKLLPHLVEFIAEGIIIQEMANHRKEQELSYRYFSSSPDALHARRDNNNNKPTKMPEKSQPAMLSEPTETDPTCPERLVSTSMRANIPIPPQNGAKPIVTIDSWLRGSQAQQTILPRATSVERVRGKSRSPEPRPAQRCWFPSSSQAMDPPSSQGYEIDLPSGRLPPYNPIPKWSTLPKMPGSASSSCEIPNSQGQFLVLDFGGKKRLRKSASQARHGFKRAKSSIINTTSNSVGGRCQQSSDSSEDEWFDAPQFPENGSAEGKISSTKAPLSLPNKDTSEDSPESNVQEQINQQIARDIKRAAVQVVIHPVPIDHGKYEDEESFLDD